MSDSRERQRRGVTKAHLADRVYEVHGGLTRSEAAEIVEIIVQAVKAALVDGRTVRLKNFGTLAVIRRPARGGVDPTNGRRIRIPARHGLSFRPSRRLKEALVPAADAGETGSRD